MLTTKSCMKSTMKSITILNYSEDRQSLHVYMTLQASFQNRGELSIFDGEHKLFILKT